MTHQVLSLSGGGYRGIFTAQILKSLQDRLGDSDLRQHFSLVAGTSIGGIIACGLAVGVKPSEILFAMERYGGEIFKQTIDFLSGRCRFPFRPIGLFRSKYNSVGLTNAINAVLGEKADWPLSRVEFPLIVVAVDRTLQKPKIFGSRSAGVMTGEDIKLRDIALATSAAPTYFPEHAIDGNNMIDGGIIANAPDMIALNEIMRQTGAQPEEIRMLSIGTARQNDGDHYRSSRSLGLLQWLAPTYIGGRAIFNVTLAAQEQLALDTISNILRDRHIRIDKTPSPIQQKNIALDKTGVVATETLKTLANAALVDMTAPDRVILTQMLHHKVRGAGLY